MASAATVYACALLSNQLMKESLIFENVETAIAGLVTTERRLLSEDMMPERAPNRAMWPGLGHVASRDAIIALGKAAHTVLADVQKRTLLASDLDLEFDDGKSAQDLRDDIERFVWSCTNTSKVVAVGKGAWRSAQMLPLADRSFHEVPPLRIAPPLGAGSRAGILVVNHYSDDDQARALVACFRESGIAVELCGMVEVSGETRLRPFCDGEAAVHVHVGHHAVAAEKLRLVDSWHSRRLALQLLPPRPYQQPGIIDALLIEDEVNGFIGHTPEAIVSLYAEVRQDRVLERQVIERGYQTVAPLTQAWTAIARDLLS